MDDINKYWDSIHKKLKLFILSKVSDISYTEDILQNVFIKIHSSIGTLKDENKINAWIYQIARNEITDHFRRLKKGKIFIPLVADQEEEQTINLWNEALADMIKMMDNLPLESCEALCLTELDGLSQKDYAQKVGISYTAAKSRVQRSRQMLKDMLLKCCHYELDRYGTVIDISPNCCCCPHK
jgi:RNA polymerase sigma-70 factor (ECF subfamily)